MHRFTPGLASSLLVGALVGCSAAPDASPVAGAKQAIQGGTLDTTDTGVVAILITTGQGIAVCTGALIAPNVVLTAHHCVADSYTTACGPNGFGTPYRVGSFAVTSGYAEAARYFGRGMAPGVDGSTWLGVSKVSVPGNDICGQDIAILQLSSSMTGVCPLIPRIDEDVVNGEPYVAVGFGITSPNGQMAGTRYSVSGMSVTCSGNCSSDESATLEWEGGTEANAGTCEGDSGGPAIDALGRVIGTVSRGPAYSCNSTVYESTYASGAWIASTASAAAQAGGNQVAGWMNGAATSDAASGYCGGSGGGGTGGGGGSSGAGGSGGTTIVGGCADASLSCVDVDGQSHFACVDPASSTSFPAGAKTCRGASDCGANAGCWGTPGGSVGKCLDSCTPSGATGDPGATDATSGSGVSTSSSCALAGGRRVRARGGLAVLLAGLALVARRRRRG